MAAVALPLLTPHLPPETLLMPHPQGPSGSFEEEMSHAVAIECAEAMRSYLPEAHQHAFGVPYRVVDYFRLQ